MENMEKINIIIKAPSGFVPVYSSDEAAGADLKAFLEESTVLIKSGERSLISTGVFMQLPPGFEAQIRPRSGLAWKHGLTVLNSPGTIDSDYRGEVKVILLNTSDTDYVLSKGERIAQMVISPVYQGVFIMKSTLEQTVRGAGGFGSTGK